MITGLSLEVVTGLSCLKFFPLLLPPQKKKKKKKKKGLKLNNQLAVLALAATLQKEGRKVSYYGTEKWLLCHLLSPFPLS